MARDKRGHRRRGVVAAAALAVVPLLAGTAAGESNGDGHTIVSNQQLLAYAERGETVRLAVSVDREPIRASDVSYVVTLQGPGGVAERCRIPAGADVGRRCVLGPVAARSNGVWQAAVAARGIPDVEGINATDDGRAGDHPTLNWDLTVRRPGGTAVTGRVWAPERYSMFNSSAGSPREVRDGASPLTLFYLHDNGWLYRARYPSYNGIYSRHRATSLGVVHAGTGVPAYRSTSNQHPEVFTIDHAEQDYYKVFLARPDASMPTTATTWDGRTIVLNNAPAPLDPGVRSLSFTESDDLGTHAGSYALEVVNHAGVVTVVVDADLDGRPSAGDVRVAHPVDAGTGGSTVRGTWDGTAPDGTVVDPTRPLSVWATIDRAAEIHFTNSDVEYRSGIEVQRLNGPAAGRATLYWDDRGLRVDGKHLVSTPVVDGRAGVTSTGGVHGLPTAGAGGGLGWGNERFIDDWTYVPAAVETLAAAPADVRILKSRRGAGPVAPGDRVTWQVEVGNFGAGTATDVTVTDLDVDPTEVRDLTLSDPSAGTVDGLVWAVGDLAPNSTATVTVAATVAPAAAGPVENRAVVESPDDPNGPPADPTSTCEDNPTLPADADGCDVVLVPLEPVAPVVPDVADLRIVKELRTGRVAPGGKATWEVRVGNVGGTTATDVVMTDVGARVRPTGGGAPLVVDDLRLGDPSKGSVEGPVWAVGDLAPGETATVTVTGSVPRAARRGRLVNHAVVRSPDDPTGPPVHPLTDCEDNTTLPGDRDGCDLVTTPFGPGGGPGAAPPPADPPARTPYLPAAGGPSVVGLVAGVAAILAGAGLLLGSRRRRRDAPHR